MNKTKISNYHNMIEEEYHKILNEGNIIEDSSIGKFARLILNRGISLGLDIGKNIVHNIDLKESV